MTPSLDRLRAALSARGIAAAVVCEPQSIARLVGYETPAEDYPISNPFVPVPETLLVSAADAVLLVPDFYAALAADLPCTVDVYQAYSYLEPPMPLAHFEHALDRSLDSVTASGGRLGVEPASLPFRLAETLQRRGHELVDVEKEIRAARAPVIDEDLGAFRRAAAVADTAQRAVKEHARVGLSEAELCGLTQAEVNAICGRRVPTFLNIRSGPDSGSPPWESTDRTLGEGELVLTDVAPWIGGLWGDSANTIAIGPPNGEQHRVFDAVRRALELAIELCTPGAIPAEVHERVRSSLSDFEPFTYKHHTGHAVGAAWAEEPQIAPHCQTPLEEGTVLACEPAVYRPGWGGIRLEHMFVVRSSGNEVLTSFEHTL